MPISIASRPAAVVMAALLAGAPDLASARAVMAQTRDDPSSKRAKGETEGAVPGKAREAAQVPPAVDGGSEVGAVRLGATGGVQLADGFTGLAIDPQVAYTAAELGPGLHLDVAGHLSVARGGATGYSGLYVAIIPAARLRYDLAARLDLYGEVGLGFFVLRTSLDNNLGSDTQVGAVLRFPIGLRYALSSGVDLVFEPAGLSIYFNSSGNKFHYSLLAGILVEI